jgi:hypothetical protein
VVEGVGYFGDMYSCMISPEACSIFGRGLAGCG